MPRLSFQKINFIKNEGIVKLKESERNQLWGVAGADI